MASVPVKPMNPIKKLTSVYLAHNFAARDFLREQIKPKLEEHGIVVTSRWITDDSHLSEDTQQDSAVHDLEDVERADALIFFSEQYSDRPGRGKYIELGYALRAGKRVIIVGSKTGCVFYHLPNIRWAASIEHAIRLLPGSGFTSDLSQP